MKILFLGPPDSPLVDYLRSLDDEIICTTEPIDLTFTETRLIDFIISYRYRFKIKKEIIDSFPGKIINLHISLLPQNRGADPNFWSFFENTPKGATIHYVDEGIDTGDIIVQKEIFFSKGETLRTSYEKLQQEIQSLFRENWGNIKNGKCNREKQVDSGSFHKSRHIDPFRYLLINGWDTPVALLESKKQFSH